MMVLFWLAVGLVLGAAFLRFAQRGTRSRQCAMLALGLAAAALLYVGFAVAGQAPLRWIGIELFGVALFGALALIGLRGGVATLALGWAAHVLWDAALHLSGPGAAYTPYWYPLLCVSFDLLVAGALLVVPVMMRLDEIRGSRRWRCLDGPR